MDVGAGALEWLPTMNDNVAVRARLSLDYRNFAERHVGRFARKPFWHRTREG